MANNTSRTKGSDSSFNKMTPSFIASSNSTTTSIANKDMLALRNYVTLLDDSNPYEDQRLDPNILLIDLTHSNLHQKHIEIRFYRHDTVDTVKQRIYQKTGTSPQYQHLLLKSCGQIIFEIPADTSTPEASKHNYDHYKLGYFFSCGGTNDTKNENGSGLSNVPVFLSGLEIHCIDTNPLSGSRGGQYEDTSLVKKYAMSNQEYMNRKGTLKDWEKQQQLHNPSFTLAKHAKQHREWVEAKRQYKLGLELPKGFVLDSTGKHIIRDEPDIEISTTPGLSSSIQEIPKEYDGSSIDGIIVGQRCQVLPGSRRGVVSYVGLVPELAGKGGYWVGVTFDEPVGKTDGSVPKPASGSHNETVRYFDAMPNYASFVRGRNVQVGDYPERDIMDELEDDSDEDDEL